MTPLSTLREREKPGCNLPALAHASLAFVPSLDRALWPMTTKAVELGVPKVRLGACPGRSGFTRRAQPPRRGEKKEGQVMSLVTFRLSYSVLPSFSSLLSFLLPANGATKRRWKEERRRVRRSLLAAVTEGRGQNVDDPGVRR